MNHSYITDYRYGVDITTDIHFTFTMVSVRAKGRFTIPIMIVDNFKINFK